MAEPTPEEIDGAMEYYTTMMKRRDVRERGIGPVLIDAISACKHRLNLLNLSAKHDHYRAELKKYEAHKRVFIHIGRMDAEPVEST